MSTAVAQAIRERFPDAVVSEHAWRGDDTVVLKREYLVEVCRFLKDDPEMDFKLPVDVCGVDYLGHKEPRFEVVYHLYSVRKRHRIRLKVEVPEDDCEVPSVIGVWRGVDWFEREAYDMYGILFTGHPDLRRILTDYGFDGHPLRKDFPTTGFVEVRYDDEVKRVVYEPVKLKQEFRNFDFLSPWESANYVLPGDEKASE